MQPDTELIQRITKVETKQDAVVEDVSAIKTSVDKIEKFLLVGNGSPAINTRIDRLEQDKLRSGKWRWGLAIPLFILLLQFIIQILIYAVKAFKGA